MQKSIEVEYWVIDEQGLLTDPGALTDGSDLVEEEFVDCLFELKTPPCETMEELQSVFLELLQEHLDRAKTNGKRLVPLGTPINSESIEFLVDERSRIQRQVVGSDLDYAKHCAGTHVHFEKRNVVDQLNVLLALDPALALCNSSPYYQGTRIADGARAYLYRKQCYEHVPKYGQLWEYADTVAQWTRRLERRYDEFVSMAREAGVPETDVAAHFSPDDVVWTPVRLRAEMPTVEWRSPDATLPSQLLQLVDTLDTLMERVHETNVRVDGDVGGFTADEVVLPAFEPLCEYAETAMIEGVGSPAVVSYLRNMGFDVDAYDPLTREFDATHVSLEDARKLRVHYADRLEADVEALA